MCNVIGCISTDDSNTVTIAVATAIPIGVCLLFGLVAALWYRKHKQVTSNKKPNKLDTTNQSQGGTQLTYIGVTTPPVSPGGLPTSSVVMPTHSNASPDTVPVS
jgi:hypothetical protein